MHNGSHPAYTTYIDRYIMNNYTGTNDNDAKKFIEKEVIPFATDEIYNAVKSDKKFNQYFKDKNNRN